MRLCLSSLDLSCRLGPAPSFEEATARVEQALDALRAAEESLERQLSDLREHLRRAPPGPSAVSQDLAG